MQGNIKWFNNQKGYGFITGDDGEDIFLHYSSIEMEGFRTVPEGARVEFEITQGEKGAQAQHVKVVE